MPATYLSQLLFLFNILSVSARSKIELAVAPGNKVVFPCEEKPTNECEFTVDGELEYSKLPFLFTHLQCQLTEIRELKQYFDCIDPRTGHTSEYTAQSGLLVNRDGGRSGFFIRNETTCVIEMLKAPMYRGWYSCRVVEEDYSLQVSLLATPEQIVLAHNNNSIAANSSNRVHIDSEHKAEFECRIFNPRDIIIYWFVDGEPNYDYFQIEENNFLHSILTVEFSVDTSKVITCGVKYWRWPRVEYVSAKFYNS